jgi:hypothetical protein
VFNNQIIAGSSGAAGGGSFYDFTIDNSVRMSDASNSQIYWQAGTPSSGNIWTASFWFKKYSVGAGQAANEMFGAGSGGAAYMFWSWDSSEKFTFQSTADGNKGATTGSPVFRDVGAWYHMVIRADTTQGTQADRLRVYLNGEQLTTWGTDSIGTSTWDYINASGFNQYWGGASGIANGNPGCNHYLADINFCDGQSYDASYFGEFKNGIWVPIDPSVTYGNNGYRLEFKQTGTSADANGIGADTSGNNNHFTVAGVTAHDVMPDTPTNNFPTLNSIHPNNTSDLNEGNLRVYEDQADYKDFYATFAVSSGKWYWEARAAGSATQQIWGFAREDALTTANGGAASGSTGYAYLRYGSVARERANGSNVNASGTLSVAAGDIIALALNLDDNEIKFYKNGTLEHTITGVQDGTYYPFVCYQMNLNRLEQRVNFGQDSTFAGLETAGGNSDGNGIGDFAQSPISGHLAICSANLPEPAIGPNSAEQADDYFNTVLYTGNGTAIASGGISVTGVNFQPDWVWLKSRTNAYDNMLFDSVRGPLKIIKSNSTAAEITSNTENLDSFDADGFTYGSEASGNASGASHVAWNWKAGGTAVSNTDGSLTSQVSAAPDAGFSIVSYTGTGANATVGHGLTKKPEWLVTKSRDSALNWSFLQINDMTTDKVMALQATNAEFSSAGSFIESDFTATTFGVGTETPTNKLGDDFICYCFHSVDGYSKVGKYVGNSSATDGAFVYTGFKPAFVMGKAISQTGRWWMYDSARTIYNDNGVNNGRRLEANSSSAESTADSSNKVEFFSNGFKVNTSNSEWNGSGQTYIYLAFAEAPFKYANAR